MDACKLKEEHGPTYIHKTMKQARPNEDEEEFNFITIYVYEVTVDLN
jgi:predicted solute-binding protein